MSDPKTELVPTGPTSPVRCTPLTPGETASRAFALFDDGVTPVDVVIRLEADPDTIEELWRTWARLRGFVLVTPEKLLSVGESFRRRAPTTAEELVDAVKEYTSTKPRKCRKCEKTWAEFCGQCPAGAARAAIERDKKARKQASRPRRLSKQSSG